MKTPEEIFDILLKVSELRMDIETAEKKIIDYGKQQYNQAIRDAESKVYSFSNDKIDKVHQSCVKKSILKLLKS